MGCEDKSRRVAGAWTRAAGLLTCATIMTMPALAQNQPAPPAQAVMDADRAFAAKAKQAGAGAAFMEYAEPRVLMLNDPEPGTDGSALGKLFPPDLLIDWGPVDGAVSADGTLGYTWGKARYYKLHANGTKEELQPSRYVTIWRKQKDGSWKFLADGGLNAPEAKAFQDRKKAEKEAAAKAAAEKK